MGHGRNEREEAIMSFLRGSGWSPDAREADTVSAYSAAFGLPFHDSGTRKGRGTILIDAHRRSGRGRCDFLAIKGHTSEADRPWPSDIDLVTGTEDTIGAIVAAATRGAAIPVAVFASPDDEAGEPMADGWIRLFDAAPIIRANVQYCTGTPMRWPRNTAPAARLSARTRAAGKYSYTSLTIGFRAAGDAAGAWERAAMADVPVLVERSFDWTPAGVSFVW